MTETTYFISNLTQGEALDQANVAYAPALIWYPALGERSCVSAKYFTDRAEGEKVVREAALRLGWTKPKWWQFWRWKEDNRIMFQPSSKDN